MTTTDPPTTPKRNHPNVPVFSPRPAMPASTLLPRNDDPDVLLDISLPPGCDLIVRSIGGPDRKSDPVNVVSAAVQSIIKTHEDMADIPVVVHPFPMRGAGWTSSCYVRLDPLFKPKSLTGADAEPRCDLLQMWRDALRTFNSDWEVSWAPTVRGTDKQMWIRFPEIRDDQENMITKITAHFEKLKTPVCSSFAMKTGAGGVILSLACHKHVESVMKLGRVDIPGVPHPLTPQCGRQIEIENAFELVIMGLTDEIDGVETILERWLTETFVVDGESTLAGIRSSPDASEALVFHMTTWQAATRVLSSTTAELFNQMFGRKYPTLVTPQSVYAVNHKGLWRNKTIRETFTKGSESMNESLKSLQQQITALKSETRQGMQAMQMEMSAISSNVASVTSAVSSLKSLVDNAHLALLAQSTEIGLLRNLADVQTARLMLRSRLVMTNDPKERAEVENVITAMDSKESEIRTQLEGANRDFQTLIGGPPGQLLPPPPSSNSSATMNSGSSAPSMTSAPAAPPGLTRRVPNNAARKAHEQPRCSSVKRRRTMSEPAEEQVVAANLTAEEDMVVEDAIPTAEVNQVCGSPIRRQNTLMVTHGGRPACSLMPKQPPTTPSSCRPRIVFRGVLDMLRVMTGSRLSHPPFYRSSHVSQAPVSNAIFFLALLVLVCGLLPVVEAVNPHAATTNFILYSLNANGMTNPVKVNHFNTVIGSRKPHVFVVNETKTRSKISKTLPCHDYDIYEEPGAPADNHHIFKWGVVVGVRKDVQVARRVEITQNSLKGRVVAVDIVLSTLDGGCTGHRIIGAYAPWNPGGASNVRHFWDDVAQLCLSSPTSWTMAGDFNATISSLERASGGADAREQYKRFLQVVDGHDLWSDNDERSRARDWTCRGHGDHSEGNIIDWIATSKSTIVDAGIFVADRHNDFVPFTDHRAIVGQLSHRSHVTSSMSSPLMFNPPARRSAMLSRIKVPLKSEKAKYEDFREQVDAWIKAECISERLVLDDDSFTRRYKELSSIFKKVSEDVFGRTALFVKQRDIITNKQIKGIVRELRAVGGAIRFEKSGHTAHISLKVTHVYRCAAVNFERDRGSFETLLQSLVGKRRLLHKTLFAERSKEIVQRAKLFAKNQILTALKGGSTKKLVQSYPFIPLPLVVNDLDSPQKLICDPEGVKSTMREYFTRLYDHSGVPELPKPWLTTPSVANVRDRVERDPFVWPRKASLADFRALLRRGNSRPSPGPDGWEKWIIKSLSDDALDLVLDLHNYQVMNSCFPGDIKDMWLTMLHKRGVHTDLSNWRGLMLSNVLANSPMAWLNCCLIQYSSEKRILPDTQVAAQPGVQTRDLMSFLAGIKCWAVRHKEPVYALKRDQMKGFDYLAPEGFHDAVRSYGLPQSIIDVDKAAQKDTKCFIRTAYGVTVPIVVSDVNKQGGPLSPIKSTFTTSLGHYYLNDLMANDPDALIVSSSARERNDPHLKDDGDHLTIAMVEATDDSFLFSRSLSSLRRKTLAMERFQYAYGWMTQWSKSMACLLSATGDYPSVISLPSVTIERGVNPLVVTEHEVPLIRDELEFLRAKVDNPTACFEELREFVDTFQFPRIFGRLPITLIRKIIAQNVISKCHAMLYLQPIKQSDAEALDKQIIEKVHLALGFPFRPSSKIANLPLSHHGFGFPSVARINAGIAIAGLSRDLNHHIKAYRMMAKITMMDWMCEKNGCIYPLDGDGLLKEFSHYTRSIPAGWIIAQKAMRDLPTPLSLRMTDQSFLSNGEVSLSHVVNICNHRNPQKFADLNGNTLRSLRAKGIQNLQDIGKWVIWKSGEIVISEGEQHFDKTWSPAARKNWTILTSALRDGLTLSRLVNGPLELSISRAVRESRAENLIRALANVCGFRNLRGVAHTTWASDGSMKPASATIEDDKVVLGAATGSSTLVLRVPGRNVSILQGEQIGLITALILAGQNSSDAQYLITDHLNSVRLIEDSQSNVNQASRLRNMNGRSYYRWILSLVDRLDINVRYTPAHTDGETFEAKMNRDADFYASSSHEVKHLIPQSPLPTFHMNDYTFYRDGDGWIESNIGDFIDVTMAREISTKLGFGNKYRMSTWAHDQSALPDFPYLRAASAHSAAVQLYARSGQLPTADVLMERGKLQSDRCRLGCDDVEDMHHVFADCRVYERWRDEARTSVVAWTKEKLDAVEIEEVVKDSLLIAAKSLFSDDPLVWPLHKTFFYLGQLPKIDPLIDRSSAELGEVLRRQLKSHIVNYWHTTCIRLAGRIFGDFQRRMAVLNDGEKKIC